MRSRSLPPDDDTLAPGVSISGLTRRFGSKLALDGVDLEVAAGEVHALLGPNGAGKTTLIRVICGLVDPDCGEIAVSGALGFVPSGDRTFYLRLSGAENLIFFGRLHGLRLREARRRAFEVLEQVGLPDSGPLPVGRYSHGMQKRLSMARALLVRPSVLLVDEATHDLDPQGARRTRRLISELAARGTAVLWTTQRIEELSGFADTITVLAEGQVRFSGSVQELITHARTGPDDAVSAIRSAPLDPADPPALEDAFLALTGEASG